MHLTTCAAAFNLQPIDSNFDSVIIRTSIRLCPHLRQKLESAAYALPHLIQFDSTLQWSTAI